MPTRINDGVYWRPVTVTSSSASNINYGLWSDLSNVTYSDLVGRWTLVKEAAPVEKEVNADEWKEVFATSAAGS